MPASGPSQTKSFALRHELLGKNAGPYCAKHQIIKNAVSLEYGYCACHYGAMNTPTPLPPLPDDSDLRRLLRFSTQDGRIRLAGQRMLLMHVAALHALRRELIGSLGMEHARRLLMRAGYAAGEEDALLARQVRPHANLFEAFSVGPQLHMLEGAVQVTPRVFEYDPEQQHFQGVFDWEHSWEAEIHLKDYGLQQHPSCWSLLGYASGYTSGFFQRPVLYKETLCQACGHAHCQIEGRFVQEWPDGEQLMQDYDPSSMVVQLDALQSQIEALRTQYRPTTDDLGPLVGDSRAFQETLALLHQAAPTQVSVLLTGETGVGKERFARALHAMSPRADQPFITVNCAALPVELIESELFGAEKGAYTGAVQSRPGRFERADGGTLLLDELGELPLTAQVKLLRVLQNGEVERLGGTKVRTVNVRIIAATNVDLEQAVRAGTFRQDLLYRLNVYPIHIPPLRDRIDDIPLLADHMLRHYSALHGKRIPGFTPKAYSALRNHHWPGNVRELENLVERGVILTPADSYVQAQALFPQISAPLTDSLQAGGELASTSAQAELNPAGLLDALQAQGTTLEGLEDQLLRAAVERCNGNLSAAARILGLTRPQLSYRLGRQRN